MHPTATVRKPLSAVFILTAGLAATILFLVYGAGPNAARDDTVSFDAITPSSTWFTS